MPSPVTGLALSTDETRIYVTCTGVKSVIRVVENDATFTDNPTGYGGTAPVLSPDGARLYVSNRFDNQVAVIDEPTRSEHRRIP